MNSIPKSAPSTSKQVQVVRRNAAELSYEAFLREYVAKNLPVVVEGAGRSFPAIGRWTPEFFKNKFGSKQVNISYGEKMTFTAFIDAVMASREDAPGPYMYRLFIGPHMPELLTDLEPQNPYAFPRRLASPLMPVRWRRPDGYLKLLIGGTGGRFPVLHYDGENAHAAITEIYGDKEFILYPPEDSAYLYPKQDMPNQSRVPDVQNPDLKTFPLFAHATQYQTVLHPGDMVFVPARWWHAARVLTPSISICQNMYDGSNWQGFVEEICSDNEDVGSLKRLAKKTYMSGLGALLSTLEHLPGRRLECSVGMAALVARLAPIRSTDVADSSSWSMHGWT